VAPWPHEPLTAAVTDGAADGVEPADPPEGQRGSDVPDWPDAAGIELGLPSCAPPELPDPTEEHGPDPAPETTVTEVAVRVPAFSVATTCTTSPTLSAASDDEPVGPVKVVDPVTSTVTGSPCSLTVMEEAPLSVTLPSTIRVPVSAGP
jgi:hypothetical protein